MTDNYEFLKMGQNFHINMESVPRASHNYYIKSTIQTLANITNELVHFCNYSYSYIYKGIIKIHVHIHAYAYNNYIHNYIFIYSYIAALK